MDVAERRLLNRIRCYNYYTEIRKYDFAYTPDSTDRAVPLLKQIDCTVETGSLNPLKFFYGTDHTVNLEKSSITMYNYFYSNNLVVGKVRFNNDEGMFAYPNLHPYYEQQGYYENFYSPYQSLHVYTNLDNFFYPATYSLDADDGFVKLTSGNVDGIEGDELIKVTNKVIGSNDYLCFYSFKHLPPYGLTS
ncbi:MAG: hypothetical protein LBE91_04725, partial [Tannerella sp.]|nr:hypothetical protein [Tannerella sp.]